MYHPGRAMILDHSLEKELLEKGTGMVLGKVVEHMVMAMATALEMGYAIALVMIPIVIVQLIVCLRVMEMGYAVAPVMIPIVIVLLIVCLRVVEMRYAIAPVMIPIVIVQLIVCLTISMMGKWTPKRVNISEQNHFADGIGKKNTIQTPQTGRLILLNPQIETILERLYPTFMRWENVRRMYKESSLSVPLKGMACFDHSLLATGRLNM